MLISFSLLPLQLKGKASLSRPKFVIEQIVAAAMILHPRAQTRMHLKHQTSHCV